MMWHTGMILLGKEVTVRFISVQASASMAYRLTLSTVVTQCQSYHHIITLSPHVIQQHSANNSAYL